MPMATTHRIDHREVRSTFDSQQRISWFVWSKFSFDAHTRTGGGQVSAIFYGLLQIEFRDVY